MKRLLLILAGFSLGIGLTAALAVAGNEKAATAKKASIVIRHQVRGCHSWAVNGGAYRANLKLTLRVGGTMTVTNNDVMPHKLVRLSGPSLRFSGAKMNHMSSTAKVVFRHAGTYRLGTKAGDDYPGMDMKTVGEDNVLRMTVKVL
jgi:plastocyanin